MFYTPYTYRIIIIWMITTTNISLAAAMFRKLKNEINKHSIKTQYFKLYKFLIYKIKIYYYYLPWLRYVSC